MQTDTPRYTQTHKDTCTHIDTHRRTTTDPSTIDKNKKAETTEGGYTGSWSTAEASGSWHCLVKLNIHIPYEPVVPLLGTEEKTLHMCTHTHKSVVMFIAVPVHSSKKLKTNQIIIVYSHNCM